jgi:glycosyltransferase involved in cell wall biosynthesis
MRIGIVIVKEDPQIGGGDTYQQEILEGLNRQLTKTGHRFYLIGVEGEKPAHLAHIDLPWLCSFQAQMLPRPPASDFEYYPDVAKANLDLLCYLHPWMGQIRDIPYISTVWDLAHRVYPFFPEVSLFGEFGQRENMFRRYLQRATYIITPNEAGKKEIVSFYQVAEDRVRLIHHPTPTFALEAKPHPDPQGFLSRSGIDRDFLLYPAQLWPHKNHILLLLMLHIFRKKYDQNLQLVLTGSDRGNFPFLTHKIAQLGLQNQVVFAGFVSQPDLVALYQNAIALVYPSFFGPENFPPLEAFALGCPVIAAQIPGAKEQLGDAAILLDPTNPELWSEAVMRLQQDTGLRQSLIAEGTKRAFAFTPDDCAREMLNLFDEFALYRRTWPTSEEGLDELTP